MIRRVVKARRTDPATGNVFDSAGELNRWHQLVMLVGAGAITELRRQIVLPLFVADDKPIMIRSERYPEGRHCRLTVDFAYRENGEDVYEDFKGQQTEAARLRIAVAEAQYGIRIRITGPAVMRGRRRRPA